MKIWIVDWEVLQNLSSYGNHAEHYTKSLSRKIFSTKATADDFYKSLNAAGALLDCYYHVCITETDAP